MARHFLSLYLLIVITLAAVSWGQDKLLQTYSGQGAADDKSQAVALRAIENQLHGLPESEWKSVVARLAAKTGAGLELFAASDIAGRETMRPSRNQRVAALQMLFEKSRQRLLRA